MHGQARNRATLSPISAGPYVVRLAVTADEVRLAQELRFRVMYLEKGGRPDLLKQASRADIDEWDEQAFHIIVHDRRDDRIVGTLRLMQSDRLLPGQSFYTEQSFDISGLRARYPILLELGRFCIDPSGRGGAILMLIWKFAMEFITQGEIDVMIGCASFPGTSIDKHIDVLSWLYFNNRAPAALMPKPKGEHVFLTDIVGEEANFSDAVRDVPPLLRGYLKLGAKASDCAILDAVFNTTFIAIYVDAKAMLDEPTSLLTSRRR